ncbi:LacI family transcriptional regulator [Cellulomonas denverensis]|uniref:LacI family transcriptional regulator n=2 Tax=Cellulomonas denverensis TaxID=264297 RepID=A0A7X6KXM3_9CELL|nr:LacI family transcriptional regulator [Cellulomonas denverensis]
MTMQDVARHAGVALSTVSATLTAARPVSAGTRARVEASMTELGYRPNALARGLASKRSHVLALAFPMGPAGLSRTSAEFVIGATEAAQDRGYQLVLWPFATDDAAGLLDVARQGLADGVLLMEVGTGDARVRALAEAGIPQALIGRTGDDGLPVVDIDFDATVVAAVQHLSGLGHRRIAFVNHAEHRVTEGHGPTVRAGEAYRRIVAGLGLPAQEVFAEESVAGGRVVAAQLLDAPQPPTAVLVMNEEAAFGLVAEFAARGVAIPGDVSVAAVVSTPAVAGQTVPPLTTWHAPGVALGRAGVDLLLSVLGTGEVPAPTLIGCGLVDLGSTGPAPRGGPHP